MEVYSDHVITTFRNQFNYWVAKCVKGEYKGLASWQQKKRHAVNLLKETLDDAPRGD